MEIAQAEEASLDLDLPLRRHTHFLSRLASNAAAPTKDPSTIEKELFTSVKPNVEIMYRVLADRSLRAVGGLSMVPGSSMSIGSHSLDPSAYIAAFGGIKPNGRGRFGDAGTRTQGALDWIRHGSPRIQRGRTIGWPAHPNQRDTCVEPIGQWTPLAELEGIQFEVSAAAVSRFSRNAAFPIRHRE